jgi:hypothetical protein
MQDKQTDTKFQRRAAEVRTIAEDIYDRTERQTVLQFVDDCEKLAAQKARTRK